MNCAKQRVLVWFARFGTGVGGRAGAKGGRGTDCRERPEDEAEKKRETGREKVRGREREKVNNCRNIV